MHFLENEALVVGDVALLGCTLWTDFRLHGNAGRAAFEAERQLTDYRCVRFCSAGRYPKLGPMTRPGCTRRSLEWLRRRSRRHAGRKIVVVTHHAPSVRSVPDRFRNDPVSAAYASSLDEFVASSGVHISGSTATCMISADYWIGKPGCSATRGAILTISTPALCLVLWWRCDRRAQSFTFFLPHVGNVAAEAASGQKVVFSTEQRRRLAGGSMPCRLCRYVVILAGDTGVGLKGLSWAQEHFCGRTVIYIGGNHEYYGQAIPRHTEKLRDAAKTLGIYFLENESVVLDDIAYLGCMLWTDFALHGNVWLAASEAERLMNDYRRVRLSPEYRKLRAHDTARLHRRSLQWLRKEIPRHAGRKIVVVTHHAPSLQSVPDRFRNDPVSAAYASSLDDFVASSGVHTWIHGHVHDSADYTIGSTRVLCNPRGYPEEINERFQAGVVVEV